MEKIPSAFINTACFNLFKKKSSINLRPCISVACPDITQFNNAELTS